MEAIKDWDRRTRPTLNILSSARLSSAGKDRSSTLNILSDLSSSYASGPIIEILQTRSGYLSAEINCFCVLVFHMTLR
ncbi:hypothetical protein BJV77DRAFT_1023178 [Russula vinacea]|nr:hypothetical protein BJV77DRAFT_1023178 [Russula vinacea]